MSIIDKLTGNKQDEVPETPTTPTGGSEAEKKPNETLEQVIGSTGQEDLNDEKLKADQRKEAVITSLKRELKENKKETRELKKLVVDIANLIQIEKKQAVSNERINAFAEKRGVDPESIRELAELLRDEVAQPQKFSKQSKNYEQKEEIKEDVGDDDDDEEVEMTNKINRTRLVNAVNKMVDDFLKDMPEYASIVDADTIKELMISNPQKYSNKTMSEIVEKIYGNSIKGKGGIEGIRNQNRDTSKKVVGRLSSKEFSEIKDDPEALREYKQGLLARVQKYGLN